MAEDPKTPEKSVAPPEKPKRPVKKPEASWTEQEWQDALDSLLRRAAAAGVRPEKLLARSSVKRGVGIAERFADVIFDALEGKKR